TPTDSPPVTGGAFKTARSLSSQFMETRFGLSSCESEKAPTSNPIVNDGLGRSESAGDAGDAATRNPASIVPVATIFIFASFGATAIYKILAAHELPSTGATATDGG